MLAILRQHKHTLGAFVVIVALTGCVEAWMGRSLYGPDGRFGWWEGDIWSTENSQRFADPYSFTHLVHGLSFFALLWLVGRRLPVKSRFLIAVLMEACWEILENSPIIINRYRAVTISLGYFGDSIVNSLSDILMMSSGFLFASRVRPWVSVVVVIVLETGCLLLVRDNLTLNLVMLIHPVDAIKAWQAAGHPLP